jgi:hypothetical protein
MNIELKVGVLSVLAMAAGVVGCEGASTAGSDGGTDPVGDAANLPMGDAVGDVAGDDLAEAGGVDVGPPPPDGIPPSLDFVSPPVPDAAPEVEPPADELFSFFVTSIGGMQALSGSLDGFGGDLGGLEGADEICRQLAENVDAGHKTWRAFLSATQGGPNGGPVHAIDRIGDGPWYDRNARLVAANVEDLLHERPIGDPQVVDDLPNEYGEGQKQFGDNHDTLTGSNAQGMLFDPDLAATCQDWTSSVGPGSEKRVMGGHSWPREEGGLNQEGGTFAPPPWVNACKDLAAGDDCKVTKGKKKFDGTCGSHPDDENVFLCIPPDGVIPDGPPGGGGGGNDGKPWIDSHTVPGCAAGVQLEQVGGGQDTDIVGGGGGYGGIYCFALEP